MGFFRRDKESNQDKDGHRPPQRSPTQSFLAGFRAGAAACVALPLVILAIQAVREGGGGGDWFREDGAAARGFVYLWSLLACAALVRLADEELAPRPDGGNDGGVLETVTKMFNDESVLDGRKAKTLLVALLMFANLCLLCAVLIVGAGEGGGEELVRSIGEGQFIGTIFLTFVFWLVWSLGSSFALHQIAEGGRRHSSREGDENMGYWAT